jgi:flavin-dependent dehydrogenase
VLVIGGGPAGTSAAITCARAGMSVTLVEAQAFPRHRPGETLHPGVEPLLKRLGAAASLEGANFLRHAGVWVERSGTSEFQAYGSDEHGPWLGYQACRTDFDALLLAQARSCGVRILQPQRALCVLSEGDRVAGAQTTAGTVSAAFTIDASGSSAWLARQLPLPYRRASRKLIAFYGYMQGECPVRDAAPCFAYRPDGWAWTARVRPNLYHWTRLFTTSAPLRSEGPPPEFAGLEPLARRRGSDVTWRLLESCAGPGYFVAGDAASVSDPSSSHGVLRAIMSGMLAGHLVLKNIFHHEPEPALAAEYQRFLHSSFTFDWAHASTQAHLTYLNTEEEQHHEDHPF